MPSEHPRKPRDGARRPQRRPRSWWAFAFSEHLPLEHETCLFLLVNLADFVVTAWLIHAAGFREANRLAVWVLQHWGWRGLLAYKFGLVAAVCLLTQAIARRHAETSRRLLQGATVLFAAVLATACVLAVLN